MQKTAVQTGPQSLSNIKGDKDLRMWHLCIKDFLDILDEMDKDVFITNKQKRCDVNGEIRQDNLSVYLYYSTEIFDKCNTFYVTDLRNVKLKY